MNTPLHVVRSVNIPFHWGWWCTPLMFRGSNIPHVRCECGAPLQWPDGLVELNYPSMGAGVAYPTEEDDK